ERLKEETKSFQHLDMDVRDRDEVFNLFRQHRFDMVIHCAAQPSHDKAKEIPLVDFDVNAVSTVNLLEATRQYCADAVFILMSTNKVYGDAPNETPLVELPTRWNYARSEDYEGIDETCRIDQSLHSLFGASKLAADVMAQEYGRYYGMNVGIFRGGCLVGPSHSGVELHGFLSYLVKVAVAGEQYTIFGYKGKQVRDQIHSYDVVRAIEEFAKNPRQGEPYNLGGGRPNSASVLESISMIEDALGRKINWTYNEQNRLGDHICYISNLSKLKSHYPNWEITRSLTDIVQELVESEASRSVASDR
ncbi:MAG: NAD-dependent epimerase/dehydratase family protein, partial [Dehalococcoidia bacterium]|nr:NAD-dependent epimerase/dehydratase family protein [Dehalococcoidia bacterium]